MLAWDPSIQASAGLSGAWPGACSTIASYTYKGGVYSKNTP